MQEDFEQIQLLAEMDSLTEQVRDWDNKTPDWSPAQPCHAVIQRLLSKSESLKIQLENPLVVATLGGTGTGKSTLVNALVGEEVTTSGRMRPTTKKPIMVCQPNIKPENIGISSEHVELIHSNQPILRDLIFIDCPDPDTSDEEERNSNLSRLRSLMPLCDVLIVTATQQKYRNARVLDELAKAATGAHLIFVQTHANRSDDIREDWRTLLSDKYAVNEIFFVDSLEATHHQKSGNKPKGDFARLTDLIERELQGSAATRIRRANYLDILLDALEMCRSRLESENENVHALQAAIESQREQLAEKISSRIREELLMYQSPWQSRLLAEIVQRWGMSPFTAVMKTYLGAGRFVSGLALARVRTPGQLALWGVFEAGRNIKDKMKKKEEQDSDNLHLQLGWEESDLREASLILKGYAEDLKIPINDLTLSQIQSDAEKACKHFVSIVGNEVQDLVSRLAKAHSSWVTRFKYNSLFLIAISYPLIRWAKNFFYDSWLRDPVLPFYGLDFFVNSAIWLFVTCSILLWLFVGRLKGGISQEIYQISQNWGSKEMVVEFFESTETRLNEITHYQLKLDQLIKTAKDLKKEIEQPVEWLGYRAG
jgi:GTPase SAR1 family protein